MEYRRLGNSGLWVSPICLGALLFGKQIDRRVAARMIADAGAAGVNFVDTADVYVEGESERIVGRLIRRDRDDWVLATKAANPMGPGPNQRGAGRKWLAQAIDGSLRRLATDYVDLYYLHRDDPGTPLAETVGAIGELIRQGKVRYWGLSNYRGWRIAETVAVAAALRVPPPVAAQPCYNAVTRMAEVEYIPACAHFGIGVVPYSPLARGVLSGKYAPGAPPPKTSRAGRRDTRLMETEWRRESLVIAAKIKAHAEKRGMTAAQFALNWVLNNARVTSAIAGPRTAAQWREYLGALDHPFAAADEAVVDALVKPGHASTPGYTDPREPVTGRVPRT